MPGPHTPHPTSHIAEVVFNIPIERSFHYLIPTALQQMVQPGMRVAAPFGPRERVGCIVRLPSSSPVRELKPIRRLIDPVPVVGDERWELAAWLSRYYYCSLGEALSVMVPSQLRLTSRTLEAASQRRVTPRTFVAGSDAQEHVSGPRPNVLSLSPHQVQALSAITEALDARRATTILLHGVTGSGKTELYLQAIDRVLAQGRSAICLVPEIALTPQTIDRFRQRFGDMVAVWHSQLSATQRALAWAQMTNGSCRMVVGARSAVFSPLRNVGVIILDEEHEPTFKQADVPRYHARDVAQARARLVGATVILGSATPAVESYYDAVAGKSRLVRLPERVEGRALPTVDIIDMREEQAHHRRAVPLSIALERLLQQTIERGEQAMLLLNRRGFSRTAQCQTCGTVVRCERCSVPLIYHASRNALVCHYCNFQMSPPELCTQCKKGYLRFRGSGTERVESELHRLFPVASIARMDRDTTRRRESHRELYEAFKERQVGVLVGTQMIAKGLDFPQVTLVGVVSADTALNLPDFRAGERTFDLLTQVAGRAGRGALPGRVLIQTYCPHHYAIQAARTHDYQRFYDEEIAMRRRLRLPPFSHLIELTLMGTSRQRVEEAATDLAAALTRTIRRRRITLLGPAPHRIPRLRRTYRMCLILTARAVEPLVELLHQTLQSGRRFRGLPVVVDVDPL